MWVDVQQAVNDHINFNALSYPLFSLALWKQVKVLRKTEGAIIKPKINMCFFFFKENPWHVIHMEDIQYRL